jgi:hypothetical protein
MEHDFVIHPDLAEQGLHAVSKMSNIFSIIADLFARQGSRV